MVQAQAHLQRNFILCGGFSLFLLLFHSVSVHTLVLMASQRSRWQISAFVTARTDSSNYLSKAAAVRNDERVASLRRTEETKVLLVENNGWRLKKNLRRKEISEGLAATAVACLSFLLPLPKKSDNTGLCYSVAPLWRGNCVVKLLFANVLIKVVF